MARPSKLTHELQEQICRLIGQEGLTYAGACRVAGIGERTFYRWKANGERASSGRYWQFWQAVKGADEEFKRSHLALIRAAATEPSVTEKTHIRIEGGRKIKEKWIETKPPSWQPAAWLLERRFPQEFGRQHVRHEGSVEHEHRTAPDAEPFRIIIVDPLEEESARDGSGTADAGAAATAGAPGTQPGDAAAVGEAVP